MLSHIIQGGAGVLPSTVSSTVDVHQVAIHIAREQLKCDCLPRRLAPWGFLSHGDRVEYHQPAWFNGLVGKNYRKAPYFMGKSMVSCRFSLKPIHWYELLKSTTKSTDRNGGSRSYGPTTGLRIFTKCPGWKRRSEEQHRNLYWGSSPIRKSSIFRAHVPITLSQVNVYITLEHHHAING